MTSASKPSCGYSFLMVLKQWGQPVRTFLTAYFWKVLMLASACVWKRYSLPMRRAGSPLQVSSLPRMAKSIPADCRILTIDAATFWLASSKLAAQPTK